MKLKYQQAKAMRRELTPPELLLWLRLKMRVPGNPVFRRQEAFGPYILDFYCRKARLAIEVDGSQHGEGDNYRRDTERDAWLESQGLFVYRLPAAAVFANADEAADGVILIALERMQTS